MANFIEFDVKIDGKQLQNKVDRLIDDTTMMQIHNLFAMLINPYVPMDEGVLSQSVDVGVWPEFIRYKGPYAHYQYMGEVYGPNIPIYENGIVVGWWSPPGKGTKHPTGKDITYNKEKHPLATKEWDKVAMQDPTVKQKFEEGIRNILIRRAKELYG